MTAPQRIQGIYTPNIVPLDDQGQINEGELRRYVDWLIDRGVHGFYPNGSAGEFTRHTPEERRRIVEIVAEQSRGRAQVIAGAAEANVRETLAACEFYAELGVQAVAIVSPFYYKLDQDSIFAYYHEIASQSPIDVVLYNIPMFANPISVATVQRLTESCERVVGIKDSSGDVGHIIRMITAVQRNRPDFAVLSGWDAAFMPMLVAGCVGGVLGCSGVVPDLVCKIFELTNSGQLEKARALQSDLTTIFDVLLSYANVPDGFREGVRLRGFSAGQSRQPRHAVNGEQQRKVNELREMLTNSGHWN